MEKSEKKYVATLFRRLRLSEETSIYVHYKSVIGHFDTERGLFIDEKGHEYDSLENASNHFSKARIAYYDVSELIDVKTKVYNDTTTIEELSNEVKDFFEDDDYDEKKNQMIDKKIRDSEALSYYDIDRISDCYVTHLKPDGELLAYYFFEEDLLHLDELTYGLNIPSLDELKKKIDSNEYSKKELEDIARRIRNLRSDELKSLELIKNKIYEIEDKDKDAFVSGKPIDIDSIYKKVIKTLIGQNKQVRRTIATISHLERINTTATKKEGFLLTGSTGTGKTLMLELIAKCIDRPLLIVNSTSLTVPGYTGTDIEEVLWGLIESCGGDVKKAERAIVYFDEIDKKGSEKNSDVSGRGVLNILLKFMDGTEYLACKNMQHVDPKTSAKISTKNMIVGAGGAFANIHEKMEEERKKKEKEKEEKDNLKRKHPIGFVFNAEDYEESTISDEKVETEEEEESRVDQFIKYAGMPSEFMGRFDDEIHLDDPDVDLLSRILLESDQSQLLIEQIIFERDFNVELLPTMEYVRSIAEQAYERKLGVRGMKALVKKSIINAYDYCLTNPGVVKTIHLLKDSAYDSNAYVAYDKDGNLVEHNIEILDQNGPVLVKMLDSGIA